MGKEETVSQGCQYQKQGCGIVAGFGDRHPAYGCWFVESDVCLDDFQIESVGVLSCCCPCLESVCC